MKNDTQSTFCCLQSTGPCSLWKNRSRMRDWTILINTNQSRSVSMWNKSNWSKSSTKISSYTLRSIGQFRIAIHIIALNQCKKKKVVGYRCQVSNQMGSTFKRTILANLFGRIDLSIGDEFQIHQSCRRTKETFKRKNSVGACEWQQFNNAPTDIGNGAMNVIPCCCRCCCCFISFYQSIDLVGIVCISDDMTATTK